MVRLNDFNAYLNSQVGEPYVWGGQHLKLTPSTYVAIITKKEKDETNRENAIAYCKKRFDQGASVLYAYDCSGLGMYYLENVTHTISHDMSANGMMHECDMVDEPKNGYWVFRLNDGKATHIGYMVSDTEVIHAKGRKYGVVRERFARNYWHRIGKPKCFEFECEEPERQPDPEPEPQYAYQIKVHGSVHVRAGNGVLHKSIGIARNCYLPLKGQATDSPYWYKTELNGKDGYITSKPKYTEIVEAE